MGTSDTDLRTPDGKHTPCVSNHPLLHKKKPKKRKKNHREVSVCPFLPPFLPHRSSWGSPSLAQRGQPRHRRLSPRLAGSRGIMQTCREVFGRPGGGREEGGAAGLQFALMMQ